MVGLPARTEDGTREKDAVPIDWVELWQRLLQRVQR